MVLQRRRDALDEHRHECGQDEQRREYHGRLKKYLFSATAGIERGTHVAAAECTSNRRSARLEEYRHDQKHGQDELYIR